MTTPRVQTELIGLPIVSLETASVVAEVDGLLIEETNLTLVGFLANLGLYEGSVLALADTRAVGKDAVIVESEAKLARLSSQPPLARLAEKGIEISGARALTLTGKEVGSIGDYFLDERGRVVGMELIGEKRGIRPLEPVVVPVAMVHSVGADLVVLKQSYVRHLLKSSSQLEAPAAPSVAEAQTPPAPKTKPARGAEKPAPEAPKPAAGERKPAVAPRAVGGKKKESTPADAPTAPEATPKPAAKPRRKAAASPEEAVPQLPPGGPSATEPPRHFLIGKRVARRVEDASGELIADVGDVVTPEMIQKAKSKDLLLVLSLNVE